MYDDPSTSPELRHRRRLHYNRGMHASYPPCRALLAGLITLEFAALALAQTNRPARISDQPGIPFKLATFEADGKVQIGLVLGSRVVDIARANAYLVQRAHLPAVRLPDEMRALIEQYDAVSKRLYEIANYLQGERGTAGLPYAYDFARVSIKAPIKYPWNLLNLAANYKAHAEGMGQAGAGQAGAGRAGTGFNAAAAASIDPDR